MEVVTAALSIQKESISFHPRTKTICAPSFGEVLFESAVAVGTFVVVGRTSTVLVGAGVAVLFGTLVLVGGTGERMGNVAVAFGVGKSSTNGGM
jgi:hypothetical protein